MSIQVRSKQSFEGLVIEIDDWETAALLCRSLHESAGVKSRNLYDKVNAVLKVYGSWRDAKGDWYVSNSFDFRDPEELPF